MMTIIFWVALWLLSGFLAAWVGHKIDDEDYSAWYDPSRRDVLCLSALGPLSVLTLVAYTLLQAKIMKRPFFKAKEPK